MTNNIALPSRCTLVEADLIADLLRKAVRTEGGYLHIDASAVEEADVSLLQLLISTTTALIGTGRDVRLSTSRELTDLARRAGLEVTPLGLLTPQD